MRWFSANWIWLVVVGGMLWMQFGMHRGHGGRGRSHRQHDESTAARVAGSPAAHGSHEEDGSQPTAGGTQRHRGC